jgi:hypothetical protein
MHTPMSTRSTMLAAAIITACATAYAMHDLYEAHTSIDGVAVPARYLEPNATMAAAPLPLKDEQPQAARDTVADAR